MDSLQKSAQGFFAKLILLFLVGCFVLWGIGDIFRSGFSLSGNVATVAGTGISQQEYAMAYRRRQEEVREMLGSAYTPEIARQLGISAQVLDHLINTLLLQKEMTALGIAVGDDDVASAIAQNPAFHNEGGHFDKNLYLATLHNNGMNEKRYVEALREDMEVKLLFGTLFTGIAVPEETVLDLYKARAEQRVANLLVIDPNRIAAPAAPSEKELQDYYDKHHDAFMAPEVRTLSYVELKLSDVEAKVEVSGDDVKHAYEDRVQDFHQPERRDLEQMLFRNEADAKVAAAKLAQGKSFDDVAKSSPIVNKGKTELGALPRQSVPAQASDAVFALKEGGVTAPVQTPFGWHIFRVGKIEPEGTASLESVRAGIVSDLKAKAAQETLNKLVGDLEDALASGATLEKAAENVGASVHTLGPVTREGISPDGKKTAPPPYPNFLSVAFATAEKDHSQATPASDGSYFLVRADSVIPARLKPLAEVKEQVTAATREEKKLALLKTVAEKVAVDLHGGKTPQAALAAEHISASVVSSGKLRRDSEKAAEGPLAGKPLPRMLVIELFGLKAGQSTQAYPWPAGGEAIGTLTQVIAAPAPDKDSEALISIRKDLKSQMQEELLEQYLNYLRGKYGVTINRAAIAHTDSE